MAAMGRPLPTADVGCPVAQLGGLHSGDEIARPTGAGRPKGVGGAFPVEQLVDFGSCRSPALSRGPSLATAVVPGWQLATSTRSHLNHSI